MNLAKKFSDVQKERFAELLDIQRKEVGFVSTSDNRIIELADVIKNSKL